MNSLEFSQYLAARNDGYWELLATATGNPPSLSKTIAGLEASAFREGIEGRAGTPSLVQQRVEALAAHRPQLLVELSKGWTKPRDMSRNLMNEENDFLFGAWLSSIRFLAGAGAVSVGDLATDLVGISEEAKVCFGSRVVEVSDWNEFIDGLAAGRIRYSDVRALDGRALLLPTVDSSELQDLLIRGKNGHPAFERMRIFRGRQDRMTSQAVLFLCETLRDAVRANAECLSNSDFCVAAEEAILNSEALCSDLMTRVVEELSHGGRPQEFASISYILLRKGWTMP